MRAVDAIMECLKAEGVDVVFGYPGGANMPTYDAFVDAGIRHILVRHEAGRRPRRRGLREGDRQGRRRAGHERPGRDQPRHADRRRDDGLGPGGVHHRPGPHRPARHRRLPGGRHDRHHDAGREALVDDPAPAGDPARRCTRPSTSRAPAAPARSWSTSRPTSRSADIPYEPVTDVHLPGYQPTIEGNTKQIRQAAKALAAARRPVLYVGGGVARRRRPRSCAELAPRRQLPGHLHAERPRRVPRAATPQWLGMLGMHGTRTANYAMDEADLICAIGARFDDRITGKLSEFAPRAKFIHIDIDPAEISKNIPAHIPIVGDAKNVARQARHRVPRAGGRPLAPGGVVAADRGLAREAPAALRRLPDTEIKPQRMIQALYEATGGDAIVTSDVGQHQMWAAQYYHFTGPAPLDQLRRPRDDGLRPAGRDGRPGRAARTRRSSASPATARSR